MVECLQTNRALAVAERSPRPPGTAVLCSAALLLLLFAGLLAHLCGLVSREDRAAALVVAGLEPVRWACWSPLREKDELRSATGMCLLGTSRLQQQPVP